MEKYIPYEKLSKKQKAALDRARRVGWGEISPVTKMKKDATVYNRKKHRNVWEDPSAGAFFMYRKLIRKAECVIRFLSQ